MLICPSACRLPAAASAGYQGGFGENLGVEICVTTDEPINQLTTDYPVCAVTHTFQRTCALWRTRAHSHLSRRNWYQGPFFFFFRPYGCINFPLVRRWHSTVELIDPANGIFSHLFAASHAVRTFQLEISSLNDLPHLDWVQTRWCSTCLGSLSWTSRVHMCPLWHQRGSISITVCFSELFLKSYTDFSHLFSL